MIGRSVGVLLGDRDWIGLLVWFGLVFAISALSPLLSGADCSFFHIALRCDVLASSAIFHKWRGNQDSGTRAWLLGMSTAHFTSTLDQYTEPEIYVCTWLGEVNNCSFLTALPGLAWVLLSYVWQTFYFRPYICVMASICSTITTPLVSMS